MIPEIETYKISAAISPDFSGVALASRVSNGISEQVMKIWVKRGFGIRSLGMGCRSMMTPAFSMSNPISVRRPARLETIGRWNDRWLTYPFPDMSEPEKAVCYLTNRGDYGESHLAQLYLKASLHAADSYFNQVRTRLSPLQRAIHSPSNTGRTWYGNQPYDPRLVQKLLDLLRLFHNYCLKSRKDKKTPAMRIGLAKAPIDLDEVVYFKI